VGATNALAAIERFGGRVPATSLVLLIYMSLVSKDAHDWPYCRLGQHALAEFALRRPNPDETDLRAVQRALKPLLDAGAVTVDRAGAQRSDGNVTARYRLNLHDRADKARAEWEGTPDGKRRVSDRRRDPQHPTKSGGDTRRKVTRHPTVSDETPDENRRPKETGGDMRSDKTKEEGSSQTASHPSREIAPNVVPFRRPSLAAENLAEAAARVAKRKAEHRASQTPQATEEIS
jgi:hypothetical protein